MKKSQMSKKQREQRDAFVSALTDAGWSPTPDNEMYDDGLYAHDEAGMQYESGKMNLTAKYSAERREVTLILESVRSKSVTLIVNYEDRLGELLELLVSHQDKVTAANFRKLAGTVVKSFEKTFVETEEGRTQLEAD